MKKTFLIRCEYPDGDLIPTQEFVENIQEYFAANIMDGERGRLVVKPVYQPREEGLVEEENKPNIIEEAKTYWDSIKDAWICPEGYIFKDENGNVINATKIVLEKKKKEYPKSYEEGEKILGLEDSIIEGCLGYEYKLLNAFQKLLMCRDAYWKIAGQEKSLNKPWHSDHCTIVYGICRSEGCIIKLDDCWGDTLVLEFPTPEMRDEFYENFKEFINECKELL